MVNMTAWVIGKRAMRKTLPRAVIEPIARLRLCEANHDGAGRLGMMEETKSLPWAAVWDFYCLSRGAPVGPAWLEATKAYEAEVPSRRS